MWYAYAVCAARSGVEQPWPAGLTPDLKVQLLWPAPDICVVASDVPDSLFQSVQADGVTSPSPAEDPAWISAAALAHHEVVRAAHERADTLPLRFGTVFRNETELLTHFSQILAGLRQRLARISGCEEFELTLQLNRLAFEAAMEAHPEGSRPSLDEELQSLQAQLWQALETAIAPECQGTFEHSSSTVAFLLRRNSSLLADFMQKGLNRAGWLQLEVTGVWPPYSFAGGDLLVESEPDATAVAASLTAATSSAVVEHQLS